MKFASFREEEVWLMAVIQITATGGAVPFDGDLDYLSTARAADGILEAWRERVDRDEDLDGDEDLDAAGES